MLILSSYQTPSQERGKDKPSSEVLARGKSLYEKKCSICHGASGKGDGDADYLLFPKPRDFARGLFKIRSTPTDELPTDDDLFDTITKGMAGTAMPSWASLPEGDRRALVQYVKTFSKRFEEEGPGEPITIGAEAPVTPERLAKGKEIYEEMKCRECHGKEGRGDGPSAKTLMDNWGYPIDPYDFTRGNRFKGGSSPKEIYKTFTTGLDGTPMPSYADWLTEDDRWSLTYYVKSLARDGEVLEEKEGVTKEIVSKYVRQEIPPHDPNARVWDDVAAFEVPMRMLWLRGSAIDKIKVKSVHNDKNIAFLIEYEDRIVDNDFLKPQDFRDAVATQFSLNGEEPFFGMGDKDGIVNIWHWKADWQRDLEARKDVKGLYVNMHSDDYQEERLKEEPTFLTGWGSGNPFSLLDRKEPVEDLNAAGLGTLTSQPLESQNVRGKGLWQENKWKVLFVRSKVSKDEADAKFPESGNPLPIAFAVWDGSQGDRDGQKLVSPWYKLRLEKGRD